MGMGTAITWADATFNGVRGCEKYSPGCKFCYAEKLSERNPANLGYWGGDVPRVVGAEQYWHGPVKWNKDAMAAGVRKKVFAFSLADVFEQFDGPMIDVNGDRLHIGPNNGWMTEKQADEVKAQLLRPITYDDVRERLFALIKRTPKLDWLLLTKRAKFILPTLRRVAKLAVQDPSAAGADMAGQWADGTPPPNVWMGASAENEQRMWQVIEELRHVPAVVRWISGEPLLEYFPVAPWFPPHFEQPAFDWLVLGGESETAGRARMCHTSWLRRMVYECQSAGVKVFVKQLGSSPFAGDGDQVQLLQLRHAKGEDPNEWPDDLRIQEFPTPRTATPPARA